MSGWFEGCVRTSTFVLAAASALALSRPADASTAYGSLNNFDCVNDTGVETHGFEIELDGLVSTDITYTYDYNHYGVPRITQDVSDPANPKVSIAERYQNVIGILNALNKANGEVTINFEVHELAGGKPCEVKVIYVGLAQAYYVSSGGDAGIGQPTEDGWKWEPKKEIAGDVLRALEILQGKQSPAFVPLPVRMR